MDQNSLHETAFVEAGYVFVRVAGYGMERRKGKWCDVVDAVLCGNVMRRSNNAWFVYLNHDVYSIEP